MGTSAPADLRHGVRQFLRTVMGEFAEASCADWGPERAFSAEISSATLGVPVHKPRSLRLAKLLYSGGRWITRANAGLTVERAYEGLIRSIESNVGARQP